MRPVGYTYSHRSKWVHPVFNDILEAAIWAWMIDSAAWEDCQINFNGGLVDLKRGQLITSVSFISKGFRLTSQVTRTFLKKLENQQMVQQTTNNRGTIITICNYSKFQGNIHESNKHTNNPPNKRLTNAQQTDNNNNKEVKEVKEVNELKEVKKKNKVVALRPESVCKDVWDDFINQRKKLFTETALRGIQREASKAGITLEDALRKAAERGWGSFEAEWIKKESPSQQPKQSKAQPQINEAMEQHGF